MVALVAALPAAADEVDRAMLMASMWKELLDEAPTILAIREPDEKTRRLLEEQDSRFNDLLETRVVPDERTVKERFRTPLVRLIAALPDPVAAARRDPRRRPEELRDFKYAYSYQLPRRRVVRNNRVQTVVDRELPLSTSPELVESVRLIAQNAEVESVGVRLESLKSVYDQWRDISLQLSGGETALENRAANLHYLGNLQRYINVWERLAADIEALQNEITRGNRRRFNAETAWDSFMRNWMKQLREAIEAATVHEYHEVSYATFELPLAPEGITYIASCEIQGRTLYFNLDLESEPRHPLRLLRPRVDTLPPFETPAEPGQPAEPSP